jgi:tetratricopeptide (TPR) repeat protein
MEYRDTTKNLRQIGDELGVATVLEGAVQRAGDTVRINVQLIDANTDEHLWANSYDRELTTKNIFEIQSEISKDISGALQATLTPVAQSRLDTIPTENLEAYNLYRAGRHNLEERRIETVELARTQFEDAIELDPDYSQAYSGLADSLLLLRINHAAISVEEAYPLAQQALDKALALDPENADAYASLGLLKLDIWDTTRTGPEIEEAELAFQKAIELNPNHARAVMWYASMKGSQQKLDEAVALYQRSLELDPLARIPYSNLPGLYAAMGRNQKALDKWLDAVRLHPSWPVPYRYIATHLQRLGRIDESIAWAVRARQLDTDPLAGGVAIGSYIVLGDMEKSIRFIETIPEDHPLQKFAAMFILFIRADYAGAIAAMDSYIVEGANPPPFALDVISDAALLIDDLDTAREYALMPQPALADDPIANLDQFNAHNVIKLAYIALRGGDEEEYADRLLRASLDVVEKRPRLGMAGHGIQDVQILALLNKPDEALARLREAIDAGFRGERIFDNWTLDADPYLASIRDEPQFLEMLEELQGYVSEMRRSTHRAESTGNWDQLRSLAQSRAVNSAAIGT